MSSTYRGEIIIAHGSVRYSSRTIGSIISDHVLLPRVTFFIDYLKRGCFHTASISVMLLKLEVFSLEISASHGAEEVANLPSFPFCYFPSPISMKIRANYTACNPGYCYVRLIPLAWCIYSNHGWRLNLHIEDKYPLTETDLTKGFRLVQLVFVVPGLRYHSNFIPNPDAVLRCISLFQADFVRASRPSIFSPLDVYITSPSISLDITGWIL